MPEALAFGLIALFTAFFLADPAHAQGFGIFEQSTCAMGRAETGVARPCADGSAIFYNPAGLAGSRGFTLSGGLTLIDASGGFTDGLTSRSTDLTNDPIVTPHLYFVYGPTDRLTLGLGAYVPYGLETVWPADFEGSFLGYDNGVHSIYIQPTAAYQLTERVAVGGGLTVAIGSVKLNQRLDLSTQPVPSPAVPPGTTFGHVGIPFHTAFADAALEAGGAVGLGANVGVRVRVTDWLSAGARYLTPIRLDYQGDARFEQVATGILLPEGNAFGLPAGTPLDAVLQASGLFGDAGLLADQNVETTIEMPAQVVVGVSIQATARLTVLADYQWTGWSGFDTIHLTFANPILNTTQIENYDDTNTIRVGAEYALNNAWTIRAGFLYNQAAAPDETVTPLLPEGNRNHLTAGFTWHPAPRFEMSLAYQHLMQKDREGRVQGEADGALPTTALNSGLYSFNCHLIGTSFTLRL